ncbi:hypothetical protein Dthio_PD1161 [Desulfonatronospira thiodismutans ASO3-1]|uniref:DUF4911 domain-containing protein n=1 Tax=Desulfonatronospira thiodismutans ASO3-1 TaxID=555779 RepID=D6ST06_9BACT|nr:DUF4911 domain-containing protein [Desulfonatronospira thiodismutans]EFI33822.1 hypothetical protein Dthio_PD1161 [Desulfonatronospira thiodismutans ASO3-1]
MSFTPLFSRRVYVELERKDIALFKFLLESMDNLAYMSVVDKYRAVVQLVYAPGSEDDLDNFLAAAGREINLKVVYRGALKNEKNF